jgi:hypothetical protein
VSEERFLQELAQKIIDAGGSNRFDPAKARATAAEVLRLLREIGADAYPSLLDTDDLRFVYQWDQEPPVLTIMWWDDTMWRDMVRMPVPPELID